MTEGMKYGWLHFNKADLEIEERQLKDEGRETGPLSGEFARVKALDLGDPANQAAVGDLLDRAAGLPQSADYGFVEPSDLYGIRVALKPGPKLPTADLDEKRLYDKVYGAWMGRICGCLLGKPAEGWRRPVMWGILKDSGRWPLSSYFTRKVSEDVQAKYREPLRRWPMIEEVECMVEDDDTNYTTIGLALMKKHGPGFTPVDVADFWLDNVPLLHTCTAERVAYRNFTQLIPPPRSAVHRNPYREWIGAQIRADFFGYAAPGRCELAAEFAWRDACISHVKNGIYGEMWAAAMISAAFVTDDIRTVISAGLAQIPDNSRLAVGIRRVMEWYSRGAGYDEAVEMLHKEWNEENAHDWCHTISNAQVVAIGLLWGELDYEKSICRAVQPCFDTDCNGATVGSVVGAILGAGKLPAKWTGPVNDTLLTGVAGYHRVKISKMAEETMEVIRKVRAVA